MVYLQAFTKDTGKYLQAATDSTPLTLADKDEAAASQVFGFFKQGRPMDSWRILCLFLPFWRGPGRNPDLPWH